MVRLNVIYTRTGDKGETGLGDGSRRPKCDARVAAMGDVDETNCAVGLARLAVRDSDRRGAMSRSSRRWRGSRTTCSISAPTSVCRRRRRKAGRRPAHRAFAGRGAGACDRRIEREPRALALLRAAGRRRGCRRPASGARRLPARRAQRGRARARSRARRSARRRSPMSTGSPTICSSPRATPTMAARPTCCGRPARIGPNPDEPNAGWLDRP